MNTAVWQHRLDHRTTYSSSYSMKHEGLGKMMHGTNDRNNFALVDKLPRLTTNFPTTGVTEESDADDYYPFVIGHGSSFKVIDPKVYKQLRRHNIQSKVPVKVADCAEKPTMASHKTPATTNTKFPSSSDSADDADEYCELSPLAKAPPIPLSTLRSQPVDLKSKNSLAKLSSFERRLCSDCYYSKTKASLVESQPSSPTSRPTTRLVDTSSMKSERVENCSQWTNEKQEPLLCGVEADELIDYASCMCCVKGIFYHCTKDNFDEGQLADEPCSCAGPVSSCAPRWGCLAILSLFIPCLCCYLPAVGCKKAAKGAKKKKPQKRFRFNP